MKHEEAFRKHMIEVEEITPTAAKSRIAWCNRVCRDYGVDIDEIITTVEKTQDLRRKVMISLSYTKTQRKNFPNGIKKYYEFVNGIVLPRIPRMSDWE
jgi:hypothetical protein